MGVIIVTGGTFGLGQSITVELARRGHQVVAFGLAKRQVSSIAEGFGSLRSELATAGCRADILEADVSKAVDVNGVVEHTIRQHGAIHGLVNNAAIGPLGTILDTDEPMVDRILAVSVKGPYLVSRAVLPHMVRQSGGSIVNIGSSAGWGKPNMAAYSASKGALVALSDGLRPFSRSYPRQCRDSRRRRHPVWHERRPGGRRPRRIQAEIGRRHCRGTTDGRARSCQYCRLSAVRRGRNYLGDGH